MLSTIALFISCSVRSSFNNTGHNVKYQTFPHSSRPKTHLLTGFPPTREIRENFEKISIREIRGKWVFKPKSGKKFQIREIWAFGVDYVGRFYFWKVYLS